MNDHTDIHSDKLRRMKMCYSRLWRDRPFSPLVAMTIADLESTPLLSAGPPVESSGPPTEFPSPPPRRYLVEDRWLGWSNRVPLKRPRYLYDRVPRSPYKGLRSLWIAYKSESGWSSQSVNQWLMSVSSGWTTAGEKLKTVIARRHFLAVQKVSRLALSVHSISDVEGFEPRSPVSVWGVVQWTVRVIDWRLLTG